MTKKIEEHENIYIHIKKETLKNIFVLILGLIIMAISLVSIMSLDIKQLSPLHQFGFVFTILYVIISVCVFMSYLMDGYKNE